MKRKWEDPQGENLNSPADIELHLETPLPLEWQRCLDIQVLNLFSNTFFLHFSFQQRRSHFFFRRAVRTDTLLQHKDPEENLDGSKEKIGGSS